MSAGHSSSQGHTRPDCTCHDPYGGHTTACALAQAEWAGEVLRGALREERPPTVPSPDLMEMGEGICGRVEKGCS